MICIGRRIAAAPFQKNRESAAHFIVTAQVTYVYVRSPRRALNCLQLALFFRLTQTWLGIGRCISSLRPRSRTIRYAPPRRALNCLQLALFLDSPELCREYGGAVLRCAVATFGHVRLCTLPQVILARLALLAACSIFRLTRVWLGIQGRRAVLRCGNLRSRTP